MGVVSDEQSCAPGSVARPQRLFELVAASCAWSLRAVLQHPLGPNRSPVAEPLLQLHFGTRASMGGTGLRGEKSCASRHRRIRRRLPLVKRRCTCRARGSYRFTGHAMVAERRAQETGMKY